MAADSDLPPADPLDAEKADLRRRARVIRNAISPEQRRSDAERVAALGLSPSFAAPGILAGYYPTPREFDCLPLLQRLEGDGWTVALPTITGDAPLVFRRWRSGEALIKGPRAMMEPASGEILRPALLFVPLLAFDARGGRLGYGGGHYDRTLEALRREGPAVAIGLAFDEQEMSKLPLGGHDQRLDWILTPSGARRLNEQEG
jgi:5-formyltetrahydrofolate cyclo-ligase